MKKIVADFTNKLILLALIPLFYPAQSIWGYEPEAKQGVICLQNRDFYNSGNAELNGEWEFYPWRFYTPQQLSSGKSPILVPVPASWTSYSVNKGTMSVSGYATFRIKIIVDSNYVSQKKVFALKIPAIFAAYKLWADTTLLFQQGVPGKNLAEFEPKVSPVIIPIVPPNDTLIIIMQLANYFSSEYAGIRTPVTFGLYDKVNSQSRLKEFWYIGGAVFCFTLGIYFFFLFLVKQERKINLLFTLTCFIIGIRYLFDTEFVILIFFPQMSPSFMFKVLCLCLNAGSIMLWTTYLFFPQETNKKIVQFISILFLAFTIIVIFVPTHLYGHLIKTFISLVIAVLIYIAFVSGIAYRHKRESAGLFFSGVIITPGIFAYNMFAGRYYFPVGTLLYLILQALAITSKFVHSHKRVMQLSQDLQVWNENLESLVEVRTIELNTANESLRKLNFAKDRFISILSHDLRNPLNNLVALSRRLFNYAVKNETEKIISYSKMINESAAASHTLAENLLDWSLIQSGEKGVVPNIVLVKKVVDDVLDLLKNESVLKNISLINSISNDCEVYADAHMTESILRNLITNGIKFTPRNGEVKASATRSDEFWEISISDNGIGMGKEDLENLFRIDKKYFNLGTDDEPGAGFGLILTKEFIKSNGGTISVKSEKEKGTVVTLTLPVYKQVFFEEATSTKEYGKNNHSDY